MTSSRRTRCAWLWSLSSLCAISFVAGTPASTASTEHESTQESRPSPSQDVKAADLRRALERQLETEAASVDGVVGYTVLDLTSGERFGRLQDEQFPTASTIKLTILYELFRQADEGKLRLDEPRALERRHVVGGSGILDELTAATMPLRDFATLMILLSDNTATNLLIDAVGMQNVNQRMSGLGLSKTLLRRRMIDLDAARRGDENVSTPAEIARLLDVIHRGEGLTAESHQGLLAILKKPKSTPLRAGVPPGIEVANKPGGLEGVAVDAGIVYLERRPYILVMMTTYLKQEREGDAAIEAASRRAYDYFNRLARGSDYGRRIR
jgi:beta-lactamase class A